MNTEKERALRFLLGENFAANELKKSEEDKLSPELRRLLNPTDIKKSEDTNQIKKEDILIEAPLHNAIIKNGSKIYSSLSDKKYTMIKDFPVNVLVKASELCAFEYKNEMFFISTRDVVIEDDTNIVVKSIKPKKITKDDQVSESLGFIYEEKVKSGLGLTRDKLPQVDDENLDDFLIHYSDKAKVIKTKVRLKNLKFSQGEINNEKVIAILNDEEEDWKTRKYIMSLDKYLLDGHHSVAAGLEVDEEFEVDVYRVNLPMKSLISRTNKMKISTKKDIEDKEIKKALDIIEKAYNDKKISKEDYVEALEKAKQYEIGEISQSTGLKKVGEGKWVDPKTGKRVKNEEKTAGDKTKKKEEDSKEKTPKTDEELSEHAKNSSEKDLKRTISDSDDPKLREIAHNELDRRSKEEAPKKNDGEGAEDETSTRKERLQGKIKKMHELLRERAKTWHKKQLEFYESGGLEQGSEDRKGMKEFLKKKTKGILKGVKDEVHEYKEFGSGMKKFFTGKKDEITKHEKKAMITVGVHMGIMIGGMAMTGGLSGLASKGVAALSKGLAIHWLEHAGITRLGHALAFAKGEENEEIGDKELDKYLKQMLDEMLKHIESGELDEEEFIKLGDNSMNDSAMLFDMEDEDNESKKRFNADSSEV